MKKTDLILNSLPWALIAAILAAFGLPPAVIAKLQPLYDSLPKIVEYGALIASTAASVITTWKAKKEPDTKEG